MGISLSKAAQWTTATSGSRKLEFTPMNESLLKEILNLVEQFSSQHPQEAEHVFEEPLQWSTTLVASDFKTDYDIRDSDVRSHEKDSEGHPLLQLSPPTVYVRNFNQLSKLIHLANDKKFEEARACVEGNKQPVGKILGPRFAAVLEEKDPHTDVLHLEGQGEDSEVKIKLFSLLQVMDNQLLSKLLQELSEQVRLDPTAVKNEVQLLKGFSSERKKRVLKSVRYTSDHEFSNGCHAPLWRQALGEICYLVIEPCDTKTLYITCSNAGIFLNGGIKPEGSEHDYERTSNVYKDLVTLLKSRSPYFAENIKTQEPEELTSTANVKHVGWVGVEGQCQPQTSSKQKDKNVHEKGRPLPTPSKAGDKYQPFPRWKNLGLTSPHKSSLAAKSPGGVPADLSSESSTESEEEEEIPQRRPQSSEDLPTEYWQIQKLVKYLKDGNQTITVVALCHMMDLDLMQETCQLAIWDLGGLKVLLNLLDTKVERCKIGSLKILRKISHNVQIRRAIVDMRGLQSIVKILDSSVKDLKALAAETIANVAKFRRARRTVRQIDGIKKLVKLLDCVPDSVDLNAQDIEVARCGALALWSCSKGTKNKEAIRKAGGIPLLGRLLKSPHENMLIPVVGILQECASEESYRTAILTEHMIKDLVINLSRDNEELKMHCALAIFKCAEDKQNSDLVLKYKGMQTLFPLLSKTDNKQLLAAVTGAIWKCSINIKNLTLFQEYNPMKKLVGLLTDQPEEVLVNVVGALGELAQTPENKVAIRECGGIPPLLKLLIGRNEALLVNVTKAVGACATDMDNMKIIYHLDGVRWVWSLLRSPNMDLQASAAWALSPCIENSKDRGELVRCLVGGLDLIVNLLMSTNNEVLASICSVISKIAKNQLNLLILTERGIIPLLAKLTNTTDARLRRYLAETISHCCTIGKNRLTFGEAGVVAPLVDYLKSKDSAIQRSTVMALCQLSMDPYNCITLYQKGASQPLTHLIGSDDEVIQMAAATCVQNIRLFVSRNKPAK